MRSFIIAVSIVVFIGGGFFLFYYWPRTLSLSVPNALESVDPQTGYPLISRPGKILIGELARFDDGLFAYLMFDYYRGRASLEDRSLLLTSVEGQKPEYHLLVRLPNDLVEGIAELANLKAFHLTTGVAYRWITPSRFLRDLHQTTLFVDTYRNPSTYRLKDLHEQTLQQYLRRFIQFKSVTDPRSYHSVDTVPSPLTTQEAAHLAADMIAVSDFYDIPLHLLIGIGAMENNYMNFPGDLTNVIWKRRAEPGDVVIKHKTRHGKRGVLVKNHSIGVWQITRESLRYAHRLFLKDKRDYSKLPERLCPPKKLDVDNVSPDVLTTYAGLLLRNLLDRFHGDVTKAVGAYNGGPGNPNPNYAEGVEMVADYARHVITRTAELNQASLSQASVSNRAISKQPSE
jgi:hypothetical protein